MMIRTLIYVGHTLRSSGGGSSLSFRETQSLFSANISAKSGGSGDCSGKSRLSKPSGTEVYMSILMELPLEAELCKGLS